MKTNIFKNSMYALALIALAIGVSSCDSDDDGKKVVILPEVVIEHSISGVVTAISGDPIEGVTVTLSGADEASVTTDSEGVYKFEHITKSGAFNLEFTKDGKVSQEGSVWIADSKESHAQLLSVRMATEEVEVVVSATEETVVVTETETSEGNEEATTTVTTTVPAGAVEAGKEVKIKVQPVYDEFTITKSTTEDVVLSEFKASVTEDDHEYELNQKATSVLEVPFEGEITVTITDDKGNSTTETYTNTSEGTITIEFDHSCTIYIQAEASITVTGGSEELAWSPKVVDAIDSSDKTVDITYSFKLGSEISGGSPIAIEIVKKYLACSVDSPLDLTGEYLSSFTVPSGAKYTFIGTQDYTRVDVTLGENASANGTKYEDVHPNHTIEVPDHNGGGN